MFRFFRDITPGMDDRVSLDEVLRIEAGLPRPPERMYERLVDAPTPMGGWGAHINRARSRLELPQQTMEGKAKANADKFLNVFQQMARSKVGDKKKQRKKKPASVSPTAKTSEPGGKSTMQQSGSERLPSAMMYEPDVRGPSPILMDNQMNPLEMALWREMYLGNSLEQALRRAGGLY